MLALKFDDGKYVSRTAEGYKEVPLCEGSVFESGPEFMCWLERKFDQGFSFGGYHLVRVEPEFHEVEAL